MKKLIALIVSAAMLGGYVYAQSAEFETMESVFSIKLTHTVPVSYSQKFKDSLLDGDHRAVITDFIKACEPYNENININFFGFDFSLNAKSNGWVEGKCSYNFSAKINSTSSYVKQMLNITAEDDEIKAIEPKMECNFNKKQLEAFADEIIRPTGKSTLSKEAVYKPAKNDVKVSKKKSELVSILTNPEVCRVVNEEEVLKALQLFSSTPFSD